MVQHFNDSATYPTRQWLYTVQKCKLYGQKITFDIACQETTLLKIELLKRANLLGGYIDPVKSKAKGTSTEVASLCNEENYEQDF